MNNIEYVVENSDNVVINKKNFVPIINTIKGSCYKHWSYKDEVFSKLKEKKIIIFAFMLESMNFCFWLNYEWTITYNGEKYYGSDTLLYTLINATNEKNIKLNINDLHNLSWSDFDIIMKNNNQYPMLMKERYKSLKETINTIYNNKKFWHY